MSARMGIYQEVLYKKHGKYPDEALFITVFIRCSCQKHNRQRLIETYVSSHPKQHLLPLPGFLLLYNNILQHMAIANASSPVGIPFVGLTMPSQWLFIFGNVCTQYICIGSVYVLTTECSSLTVTLVVTLRKFVSLLFSIVYFSNPFTIYHWIGTLLVFVGTVVFTEVVPNIQKSLATKAVAEKKTN